MTNNQTKCGIICDKTAMRAADDERMINYDWPYMEISRLFKNIIKTEFFLFFVEFLELNKIVCQMVNQKEESKTTTSVFLLSVTGN